MALLLRRETAYNSHNRAVLNHDEVYAAVHSAGWNVNVFSDSQLPDLTTICSMFFRANLLIGPHGAGFANMVCSGAHAALVENIPRDFIPGKATEYGRLAEIFN